MCKPSPAKFLGIGLIVILAIFGFGYVTMLLWNWLIPAVFSGPVITYWQALGLLVLSKLLFSGGHRGGHKHHHRHGGSWKVGLENRMRSKVVEHSEIEPEGSSPEKSSI